MTLAIQRANEGATLDESSSSIPDVMKKVAVLNLGAPQSAIDLVWDYLPLGSWMLDTNSPRSRIRKELSRLRTSSEDEPEREWVPTLTSHYGHPRKGFVVYGSLLRVGDPQGEGVAWLHWCLVYEGTSRLEREFRVGWGPGLVLSFFFLG